MPTPAPTAEDGTSYNNVTIDNDPYYDSCLPDVTLQNIHVSIMKNTEDDSEDEEMLSDKDDDSCTSMNSKKRSNNSKNKGIHRKKQTMN